MRKKIFNNSNIIIIFLGLFIGCFIGYDLKVDFLNLYISKLSHIPIRYTILILTLTLSYSNFINNRSLNILFRYKTFFDYVVKNIFQEILLVSFFFIIINFVIFLFNINNFFINFSTMMIIIFNDILVTILIITIVKLLDIKFKNRIYASSMFISIFMLIDFILEHYNFYLFDKILFDFSYIYILPFCYKNYIIVVCLIIMIIMIMLCLISNLIFKKDYFLYDKLSN